MNIKAIGLDTAKSTFQLHGVDAADRAVLRKRLTRAKLLEFFAQLAPCLIGLEACGAAHHWARKLTALGHTVRLIPAQYVKAFVKRNKNDAADAEAICEALLRPNMRFVPVKQPWQQDIQSLHRIRSAAVAERTALSNQLRGLLAEYGLIAPKGLTKLRQTLPAILEDADNGLSGLMRTLIDQRREALERLDQLIAGYDRQVAQIAREHPDAERLITAPGIGPLTATALIARVSDPHHFANGRGLAASLGLTQRQHSTANKQRLLSISKAGDGYVRMLLIHGARAVLANAHKHPQDRLCAWALAVKTRRGKNIATVAVANKLARIAWAILAHACPYRSSALRPAQSA